MNEKQSAEFHSKISEGYDKLYDNAYWKICGEVEDRFINMILPEKKGIILDAGGGTGEYSIRFAKLGHDLILTDISQGMIETATKKIAALGLTNKIRVLHQDICNMTDLDDNSFDFVLSVGDPVSYCGKEQQAIQELARVAKPNAYVMITVDSFFHSMLKLLKRRKMDELESLLVTHKTTYPFDFPQHNFRVNELKGLFSKAGLRVEKIFSMGSFISKLTEEELTDILHLENGYNHILNMELKFCDDPAIIGFGHHLGVVGKKSQ